MNANKTIYQGMLAETIRLTSDNGDVINGYMARPIGSGVYGGVVVIHEAFGIVEWTRQVVRKFADHGYIAVAPDLYSREGPPVAEDMASVVSKMSGLADATVIKDLEGAAKTIRNVATSNGKVGCIGYCSGGRHTLLFACNTKSLQAAVNCYGGRVITDELSPKMPKAVIDMIPGLACPLLGLFGESDQNPSPEHVARLDQELKKHRKQYEFKSYPGDVGHGFFADYRPSYRQAAAADGWQRVFDFHGKHLA